MAEAIKWVNGSGLTLVLSWDEREELRKLLESLKSATFVSFSSKHFEIKEE